jgi:hypothetical protein
MQVKFTNPPTMAGGFVKREEDGAYDKNRKAGAAG